MVSDTEIVPMDILKAMTAMRYELVCFLNLQIIFKKMTNFFKDFSRRKTDNDIAKIVQILLARSPTDSKSQRKIHQKEQKRRQAIYLRHFLF